MIKAADKIVKQLQASNKGGILKAQQRKYSVSCLLFLQIPAWGLGSPCGYDATSLLAIATLIGLMRVEVNAHSQFIFQYKCTFSSMRAVKIFL